MLKSSKLLEMNPIPTSEVLTKIMIIQFEYVRKYMMINGKIENVLLVIDSSGNNVFTLPYGLLNKSIAAIQLNYRGVARSVFILNAPKTFAYAWKTISYFLDESTARKVQISNSESTPDLIDLVAPNQLE